MSATNLRCEKCGVLTAEELHFCFNCRTSLTPKNSYDLGVTDFAYAPDLDAMRTLNATGPLPYLLKKLSFSDLEKTMVTQLSATGYNVPSPSELDSILRQCAITLSIASLPKLFVIEGDELNAFTFGSEEDAYLVLDASLLRTLTQLELMAVIAHELGHVKSGHMVYHTLAEALGRGISISAALMGLNVISIPLQLALLSWHRQSEVTADRASLLVVKEIEILQALLTKIASSHRAAIPQNSSVQTRNGGLLETAAGLFRTHPAEIDRFTLAKEFQTSQEFSAANRKVELRQRLLRGLIPVCRFCGERKRVEDLFCLKCGKCQT